MKKKKNYICPLLNSIPVDSTLQTRDCLKETMEWLELNLDLVSWLSDCRQIFCQPSQILSELRSTTDVHCINTTSTVPIFHEPMQPSRKNFFELSFSIENQVLRILQKTEPLHFANKALVSWKSVVVVVTRPLPRDGGRPWSPRVGNLAVQTRVPWVCHVSLIANL